MRSLLLAVLLVASGGLAACGGDDGGADAAPIDALPPPDVDTTDAPPACHSCMDILAGEGEPPLCPGSEDLFIALNTCICTGACMADCGDNVCMNMAPTTACNTCMQDMAAGCGTPYAACAMD